MKNREHNMPRKKVLKNLLSYTKKYKYWYLLALILGFFAVLTELIGPILLSNVVDNLTSDEISLKYILLQMFLYFLISVFISLLLIIFERIILIRLGQKIVYKIREDIFVHTLSLSHKEFTNIPTGKLVTRLTSDTFIINEMFTQTIVNMIRDLITALVSIIIMLYISYKLSLIVFLFTPILLIITYIFIMFSKYMYRIVKDNNTDLNTFTSESINGIRVIKAYNTENKEREVFKYKNDKLFKSNIKQMSVFAIFRPLIYSIYLISVLIILYLGGKMAIDGVIKSSVIVAFYSYISYYYDPIVDFAELLNTFEDSLSSCEKIFILLDILPSVKNDGKIVLDDFKGDIEFKHVYFKYSDNSNYILKDVSFKINRGETIALVGPTGGGKSTIINLIERNYDVSEGEILIDGVNIKDIELDSLRKNIGMMLQDVHLFSGSVYDNIRLFDESISNEECIEAAKKVSAYEMINSFENGFDTNLFENGGNLSGGERQLLSFSRAVALKPKMMILDEATANIDTKTESLIQKGILELEKDRTMIIVAHRLSTIKHATRILVVNCGTIIEEGSHKELMDKKGLYYNLYLSQYKN